MHHYWRFNLQLSICFFVVIAFIRNPFALVAVFLTALDIACLNDRWGIVWPLFAVIESASMSVLSFLLINGLWSKGILVESPGCILYIMLLSYTPLISMFSLRHVSLEMEFFTCIFVGCSFAVSLSEKLTRTVRRFSPPLAHKLRAPVS